MLGKKSLFGGFIGLFFFAIIVFFIIYFLTPEISIKFFGIAFQQEAYVEHYLENSFVAAGLSEEDAEEAVSSEAGKQFVSFLISNDVFSETGKTLIKGAVDSAKLGLESFFEYANSQENFS